MLDAFVLADCLSRLPHHQAFQSYPGRRKPVVDKSVQTARQFADYSTLNRCWKHRAMIGVLRHLPTAWIVRSMLRADLESDISDLFR